MMLTNPSVGNLSGSARGFNVPASSNFNRTPTTPNALQISDYEAIAAGNVSDVMQRVISPVTRSFDNADFGAARDAFGNSYFGGMNVPAGGELTDVNIAPDLNLKISFLESQKGYLNQLVNQIVNISVAGVARLLQEERGLDPQTAQQQAQQLVTQIQRKAPQLIQAAREQINRINQRIESYKTYIQGVEQRYQQLQNRLGTIISGFNGNQGGGAGG
ncbi:MAG: hypothetical protein SFT81_07140 [Candidatus Caenarcaniphilales bacterium]|nr:hypothetical protein [Candidatus Caenarcaniphilales bacterium]